LEVWNPDGANIIRRLGWTYFVLDSRGSVVAWTEAGGASCTSGECRLHITDVSTGSDRVIVAPAGSHGFLGGGAIAPDGRTLAAFINGSADHRTAALVLIDIPSGHVAGPVEQSTVAISEPAGAARWSTTSQWLFFSGLDGLLREYATGDSGAQSIPEPASYNFAVT
jgi:hypothetical protein